MDNILEVKNVSFVYSKGTPFERVALDDVSVSFERGKITGLIGHTGSGKSTLVSLFNGLSRPTTGQVLLAGEDIWLKPRQISKIRYRVGLVMQYPEYQLFDETVRKDISFAPKNLGLSAEQTEERVLEAARFAGLSADLLDKSPFELSGGQKRRAAIAGVLAMSPEVLVLDEPAAGLDPRGRREILGGLIDLVKEKGTTVILVSHSMEDMATYCDNIVVMNNGKIHSVGTKEEIFASASSLTKIGLDAPSVTHIVEKLKARGIVLGGELYTVDGVAEAVYVKLKGGNAV